LFANSSIHNGTNEHIKLSRGLFLYHSLPSLPRRPLAGQKTHSQRMRRGAYTPTPVITADYWQREKTKTTTSPALNSDVCHFSVAYIHFFTFLARFVVTAMLRYIQIFYSPQNR